MANFRLSHRHTSQECRAAFACWRGFASPLRHHPTTGSCHIDDHQLWWDVQADNADAALALLPPFIAQRTTATPTGQVPIP